MRIAIDLDGVVFNSDMFFMAMGEIYDCRILGRNSLIKPDESRVQEKYNWNDKEIEGYIQNFSCDKRFDIMPCAAEVINFLKDSGNEVYFVSARGQFSREEVIVAKEKLETAGLQADKYFWNCSDKGDFCKEEQIDAIIDDRYDVGEGLEGTDIVFLHFRMAGKRKAVARKNLYEVHNWGEIYRIFSDLQVL